MKPAAPPSMDTPSCSQKASWSTPAESTAQGVEIAADTASHAANEPGYSSLSNFAPHASRRTALSRIRSPRRAANAAGVSCVQAVRHRLDDAQELLPAAVVERRPDELRGVAVDVLAVRPDEDHDLGSCCTALTCSGGAEAIDQPRPAQPADGVEAIRLDPHQEPHIAGQPTALDDLDHGNVRIEKHRAGVAPYGVDDVVLDRTLRLGVGRQPGRLQHLDQRVAVIGGYDGQPAAGVGDPRQRGDLGRREVFVATLC